MPRTHLSWLLSIGTAALLLLAGTQSPPAVEARVSWHAQHGLSPARQTVLEAKLGNSLFAPPRACPDTLSCPAGGGPPVDRCCSPAMGLLVFVQQWYPKLGPSDAFTLHGLWPDECNGDQGPRNGCDSRRNYPNLGRIIKNADPDLYTSMTTFWPSYKKNVELFWSHEWNKHGTCVSTLEPQCLSETAEPHTDVLVYFRTALALREQFNPYKVLADKNIVPGNLYDRELITTTLQEAWGVPVRITCRRGQINEIWLWMKVRGRDHYIATPPVKPSKAQECGSSIYYPPKGGRRAQEVSQSDNDDDDDQENA